MAARQYRSTDTSSWLEGFGNGSDSSLTISSPTTDSTANTNCTGTSGTTTLTVGSATGFANGNLLLIIDSRVGGVGTWELNKISSGGTTTTWTLAYALTAT